MVNNIKCDECETNNIGDKKAILCVEIKIHQTIPPKEGYTVLTAQPDLCVGCRDQILKEFTDKKVRERKEKRSED